MSPVPPAAVAPATSTSVSLAALEATVSQSSGAVPKVIPQMPKVVLPQVAPKPAPQVDPKVLPKAVPKVFPSTAIGTKKTEEKKPKVENVKSCFKCLGCGEFLAVNVNICRYGISLKF